ncbi:MAG: hypothetical protein ABFS12_11170 [Bacteroidota bacterium]
MKQEYYLEHYVEENSEPKIKRTRNLTIRQRKNGSLYAVDRNDDIIIPTEKELELYNRVNHSNPIAVKNGWLTFIGIILIINIFIQLLTIIEGRI